MGGCQKASRPIARLGPPIPSARLRHQPRMSDFYGAHLQVVDDVIVIASHLLKLLDDIGMID
jgi:hypothetical protein